MSDFLTVKDAAQKTGKSSSSIRRIIYPIIKDDSHPDRQHVRPTPEEARELRLKGENFPWRLSQELLDREVTSKPAAAGESHAATGEDASLRELNIFLRDQLQLAQVQLQVKDQQIATSMELTKGLHERLREGNVLIGTLQRQLALGEPTISTKAAKPVSRQPTAAPPPQRPGKQPPDKKPKPKKGLWSRMFG